MNHTRSILLIVATFLLLTAAGVSQVVLVVDEGTPVIVPDSSLGDITVGKIALCDGAANGTKTGCATNVSVSDLVTWADTGNRTTLITMCSDPGDSIDNCSIDTTGALFFAEQNVENGVEVTPYDPKNGEGIGGVSGDKLTYELISDTPEPQSLLLFGSGLLGLGGFLHRRLLFRN